MQPPTSKQAAGLPEPAPTSFSRRLVRFLVRMLLIVLAGIGLGLGAYYGLPAVYTGFIQPVQINTRQIGEIESALEAQRQSDQARLDAIETRLTGLETDLAANREALGALQADMDSVLTLLRSDHGDLQRLRDLEVALVELQSSADSAEARLTALEGSLSQSAEPVDALRERVQLLRAMELVLRARLSLADNNPGLAGEDLRRARGILSGASAPAGWAAIVNRLDMALANLSASPLVAVQDVEAAWYLMLEASAP
jgi:chromosome segregation ATPase